MVTEEGLLQDMSQTELGDPSPQLLQWFAVEAAEVGITKAVGRNSQREEQKSSLQWHPLPK